MLDGLPIGWLGPGSGWALVGLFVLMMATDRLVSHRSLLRERVAMQERISDFKAINTAQAETLRVQTAQLDEILTALRAMAGAAAAKGNHTTPAAPARQDTAA